MVFAHTLLKKIMMTKMNSVLESFRLKRIQDFVLRPTKTNKVNRKKNMES